MVSLVSLPLLAGLMIMLRHAFRLRPGAVALLGSFAVAALATSVLLLIHPRGASLMVLGWNLGSVGLMLGLGRLFGPAVLGWAARWRIT